MFSERAVRLNDVTDIQVSASAITISIAPRVNENSLRPEAARSLTRMDSEYIIVQGLGVQGRVLRYEERSLRLRGTKQSNLRSALKDWFAEFTLSEANVLATLALADVTSLIRCKAASY